MENSRKLALLYLGLVLVKIVVSLFVVTPTIYGDEYVYAKLARSMATSLSYSIHEIPTNTYPPLYAIMLAPAYIAQNMDIVYILMKLINALLSTAIIIPAFLLAKEILAPRESLKVAALVGLLPGAFAFTPYIMAENLFYPLFLTAIYFLYKAQKERETKHYVYAGIIIGLAVLTKLTGIVLLALVVILGIRSYWLKQKSEVKKYVYALGIAAGLDAIWVIRNITVFGFSLQSIVGQYAPEITTGLKQAQSSLSSAMWNGVYWGISYAGMFILASGIIFMIGYILLLKEKENKELVFITGISALLVLFLAINHNLHGVFKEESILNIFGRPITRYIDTVLPLFIITGYAGLKHIKKITKQGWLFLTIIVGAGFNNMFFPLLPINNMSLAWIGVIQEIISPLKLIPSMKVLMYVVLVSCALILSYVIMKRVNKRTIATIMIMFFSLLSVTNVAINAYNSQVNWYPLEQVQIGKWIGKNTPADATIMFDEKYCTTRFIKDPESICTPSKFTTLAGFWINRKIIVDSDPTKADYLITKEELEYTKIYQGERNIYVYKVG